MHLHSALIIAAALLVSCESGAQDIVPPEAMLDMTVLERAIAYGDMLELNDRPGAEDAPLVARLFSAPTTGACVPETETTCGYAHVVSVATVDAYPETGMFGLKTDGEIVGLRWIATDEVDTAVLEGDLYDYPRAAMERNPALASAPRRIRLTLRLDGVDEVIGD